MIPVTLSAPGYDAVTVNLMPAAQGAASSAPPPASSDSQLVATWNASENPQPYDSGNLPAGSKFHILLNVSADDSFTGQIDCSQSGTLGGSFKDCVISDAPGNFSGFVVCKNLNSARAEFGFNYPTRGQNLTPGTWVINCLVKGPGGAIISFSKQ